MLFLFLDCETTGLTKMDQIMEVGAVLVDFDEDNWQMTKISKFETLIKIDTQIDDKISRITGIDNQLLNNAPKLEIAQNLWQNWLCENIKIKENKNLESNLKLEKIAKINIETKQNEQKLENKVENQETELQNFLQKIEFQDLKQNSQLDKDSQNFNYKSENSTSSQENSLKIAIIGHSLGFDLGFLKRENWFLPESFERIDTLDLSKIFLPHLQAVNLEFLTKKLNLSKQNLERNSEINSENKNNLEFGNQLENKKKIEITAQNKLQNTTQTLILNLTKNSAFNPNSDLISNKNFHRAKFDAICCNRLLEYLLEFMVFCSYKKDYFTPNFWDKLSDFLPLNLSKLQKIETLEIQKTNQNSKTQNEIVQNRENKEKIINLQGLEITSIEEKLNNWEPKLSNLGEMLNQKLPKNLTLLTLQLYFVAFFNENWKELNNLFESRNMKISKSVQNSSEAKNSMEKPKLKLHTQKDLFVIAALLLENN